LVIGVVGRPAPQGSKNLGGAGQLLEASGYLGAWRTAVKVATYKAYRNAGIDPTQLPVFGRGVPLRIEQCVFYMAPAQGAVTSKPDVDKLLRSTLDALGGAYGKSARLFADDSQIVWIDGLRKVAAADYGTEPGVYIAITDEFER
jgi:Holliday junction resolvase RusA-like endonuclease